MASLHHHYHPLSDTWAHGISVLRAILTRWSELDITHAGSVIAIAGVAPSVWPLARTAWREVSAWVSRFFLASVTIPGGDPLNRHVVQWLRAHKPRHYRTFTGRSEVQRSGDGGPDRAAALKRTRHPVQYYPHWASRWF